MKCGEQGRSVNKWHDDCSSNLAGGSLVRIVEEELIAVGIVDHQEPVAPRTILDRNALGLEFGAQRVQCGDCSLVRRGSSSRETFREMNISALPIFSGHWLERMSAQPCRSTCATYALPSSA